MTTSLLLIHALSPLHAGTGQSAGPIDLAIAREKATGIPYLPGSSIKGVLRDRCESTAPNTVTPLFGPPTERASDHAGSLHFGDARLLFLPVRSFAGTFAWVTSPLLLARLSRDLEESGRKGVARVELGQTECLIALDQGGQRKSLLQAQQSPRRVVLEELDLAVNERHDLVNVLAALLEPLVEPFGLKAVDLQRRVCVVSDDVMSFLLQQATEVTARIRLDDDKKTVAQGALWYEEALPAETILVSLVLASPPRAANLEPKDALAKLSTLLAGSIQFGGKATVGRGLCRAHLATHAVGTGGRR